MVTTRDQGVIMPQETTHPEEVPPTIEACNLCKNEHSKELDKLNKGISLLHDAINKVAKEYGRLHLEEDALLDIEEILKISQDNKQTIEKIESICNKVEALKTALE